MIHRIDKRIFRETYDEIAKASYKDAPRFELIRRLSIITGAMVVTGLTNDPSTRRSLIKESLKRLTK